MMALSPAGETAGLGLLSAAIWGTSDFVGGIAARRIPSAAVVAVSHSLSLLLLVALAIGTGAAFPDRTSALYGLAAGLACGTGVITLYKALALGGMGVTASVSGVLAAALPVAFAFITEGLPHRRQWIGFLLAALAIWMIAAGPEAAENQQKRSAEGLVLGAVAGISFGCLFILLKLAGRSGVLWPLTCSRVSSASLAVAVSLMGRRGAGREAGVASARAVESRGWGASWTVLGLAAMAGVFDASGNSFYTIATRMGRLDIAAVLSSLYPAATILLAALVLKERTTRTQTTGMALALGAVVLISG